MKAAEKRGLSRKGASRKRSASPAIFDGKFRAESFIAVDRECRVFRAIGRMTHC